MYESQKINIVNLMLQNFAFGLPIKPKIQHIIAFLINVVLFGIQVGLLFLKMQKVTNLIIQSVIGGIITWLYFLAHVINVPIMKILIGGAQRSLKVYQAVTQSLITTITIVIFYYSYNNGYFNWIVGLFFVFQLSIVQRYTGMQLGKFDSLRNLDPALSTCMYLNMFIIIQQMCLLMGRLTTKIITWACAMFIGALPFLMAFGILPSVVQLLAIILDAPSIFFKMPLKPFKTSIFTIFYGIFYVIAPYEALFAYTLICASMMKFKNQTVNISLIIFRWVVSISMLIVGIGFKIAKLSLYKVLYQPECLIIPQLICNLGIGINITCTTCIYIFNHENNVSICNLGFGRRHVRIFNCYVYPVFALLLCSLQLVEIVQCFNNYLYFNCILTAYSIGNLLFDRPASSYGGAIGCGVALLFLRKYENYIPSMAVGISIGSYGYDVLMKLWYGFQYMISVQSVMKRHNGLWILMYIPNSLFLCVASLLLSPILQISPKIPLFIPSFMRPRYWDTGRLTRLNLKQINLQNICDECDTTNQQIDQIFNCEGGKQLKHLIQGQFWRHDDGLLLLGPIDDYQEGLQDKEVADADFRNIKTPNQGVFCLVHGQDLINNSICVSASPIKASGPVGIEEVRTLALNGIMAQNRRHQMILRKHLIKTFNIQRGTQKYGSQKPDERFSPSSLITYAGQFQLSKPRIQTLHLKQIDSNVLRRIFVQLLHEIIKQQQHWLFFMDRIPRPRGAKVDNICESLDLLPQKDIKIEEFIIKLCYLDKFELYNNIHKFHQNYGLEGQGIKCYMYKYLLRLAYRTMIWGVFTQRLSDSLTDLLNASKSVCFSLQSEPEYALMQSNQSIRQNFKIISETTAEIITRNINTYHIFRLHSSYFKNIFATAEHFHYFYGIDRVEAPQLKIEQALYQTLFNYAYQWEQESVDGYII